MKQEARESEKKVPEIAKDRPVYSIGVVADLLGINTETIRVWEKAGVIPPTQRRSGKRFYSQREFKRLQFAHSLSREGLSVRAMLYYLQLYPCWKTGNCHGCQHNSSQKITAKPCWQEEGTFCQVANIENPCINCQVVNKEKEHEIKVIEKHEYSKYRTI